MRVGLALGGGASRGFAHIGVLEVLEREGFSVDLVAGTSAGAVAGSCYAAGVPMERLRDVATRVSRGGWLSLSMPALSRQALLDLRRARGLFLDLFGKKKIEDLPVRFFAGVCDLKTGEEIYLTRGDLIRAVLASTAVPGVFRPTRWGDHLLADGCVLANVPVRPLLEYGADTIVAVDLFGHYRHDHYPSTLLEAGTFSLELMLGRMTHDQLQFAGERCNLVVISPDLHDVNIAAIDPKGAATAMERGRMAAELALERLSAAGLLHRS